MCKIQANLFLLLGARLPLQLRGAEDLRGGREYQFGAAGGFRFGGANEPPDQRKTTKQ
jgi:hypothetical protein